MPCIWKCPGACWFIRSRADHAPPAHSRFCGARRRSRLGGGGCAGGCHFGVRRERASRRRSPAPRPAIRFIWRKALFKGGLVIDRPGLTIEGEPGATLDGDEIGNVVTIKAPDTTLRGLTIQRSGQILIDKNSGVFVDRTGDRAQIEDNRFSDNLIAIYLDGPHDAMVRRNEIVGLRRLRRTRTRPGHFLVEHAGFSDHRQ